MGIPGKQRLPLNVLAVVVSAVTRWKFGPGEWKGKLCGTANAIGKPDLPVIRHAGKGELWWVQRPWALG